MLRSLLLSLLAAALSGCGDTVVDPFLRDAGSFSVSGVVTADGTARTHTVRVQQIRALPDAPTQPGDPGADFANVRVESEDLETGARVTWTLREVFFADGTVGGLYSATFEARPGARLALSAQRVPDGRPATADIQMPPVPVGVVLPAEVTPGPDRPAVHQRVAWPGTRPDSVAVLYGLLGLDGRPTGFRRNYVAVQANGTWEVVLDLVADAAAAEAFLRTQTTPPPAGPLPVLLRWIQIDLRTQSDQWETGGADPAQPDVRSNVTDGRGFVGGVTWGDVRWQPDGDAARAAGFQPLY